MLRATTAATTATTATTTAMATRTRLLFNKVPPAPKNVYPVPIGVAQTNSTNNDLFSPSRVYCAAVILPKESPTFQYHLLLQSSEKWQLPQQRADVSNYIKKESVAWAVFYAHNKKDYSRVMHDCIEQVIKDYEYQKQLQDDLLEPSSSIIKSQFVVFFAERSSVAAADILAHGARDAYISAADWYPPATAKAEPYGLFVGMAPEMPWPKA